MSTRSIILDEIQIVAAEQNKSLPPLTDDLGLLDSGLDSLCLAILVSRLEDLTGSDPFQSATSSAYPRTLGDLIALYEKVGA
jgi:acyl carrier protein